MTLLVYLSTMPRSLFWHQKQWGWWQTKSKGQFAGSAALTGLCGFIIQVSKVQRHYRGLC